MKWVETIWGLTIVALVVVLAASGASPSPSEPRWIHLRQPSGHEYYFRQDAVEGFLEPVPGDSKGRNGILLRGGYTLMVSIDLDEFRKLTSD